MSFLNQQFDSSDDENDSSLFRHSDRSFDAIIAEQQRNRRRHVEKQKSKPQNAPSDKRPQKRKSEQYDSDGSESDGKRLRSSATPQGDRRSSEKRNDSHEMLGTPRRAAKSSSIASRVTTPPPSRDQCQDEVTPLNYNDGNATEQKRSPVKETYTVSVAARDEESDDEFAEMIREVKRAQKQRAAVTGREITPIQVSEGIETPGHVTAAAVEQAEPIIEIFLSSHLPATRPLLIKVRLSQRLGVVRQAWCRKQGFTDETMKDVFLVYRLRKIYDMSTCRSLGLDLDANGRLSKKGAKPQDEVDKVHLQAATEEIFEQMKDGTLSADGPAPRQSHAVEAKQHDVTPTTETVDDPVPAAKIHLVLRTNSRADFRITTKPGTSIGKMIKAYRKMNGIGTDHSISLSFDGDTIPEQTFVRDTELTDMDIVDVHIS